MNKVKKAWAWLVKKVLMRPIELPYVVWKYETETLELVLLGLSLLACVILIGVAYVSYPVYFSHMLLQVAYDFAILVAVPYFITSVLLAPYIFKEAYEKHDNILHK